MVEMAKTIRHKWKDISSDNYHKRYKCERCGCERYWDFSYDCVMYKWGTHLTYRAPDCLLPNTINYDGKRI